MCRHWQTKPDHYVSHLIGHEGPGSILSILKQKSAYWFGHPALTLMAEWATGLVAGGGQEGSNFSMFRVEIELTPAGFSMRLSGLSCPIPHLCLCRQR